MQIDRHYTVLLYPFFHNLERDQNARRLQELDHCWLPWWRRLECGADSPSANLGAALDDTYFFLPSIRELLFPETKLLGEQPVASCPLRCKQDGIMVPQAMLGVSSGIEQQTARLQQLIQQPASLLAFWDGIEKES